MKGRLAKLKDFSPKLKVFGNSLVLVAAKSAKKGCYTCYPILLPITSMGNRA